MEAYKAAYVNESANVDDKIAVGWAMVRLTSNGTDEWTKKAEKTKAPLDPKM